MLLHSLGMYWHSRSRARSDGHPVRAEQAVLLTNVEIDGTIMLDSAKREQIEAYLHQHGTQDR